MSPRALAVLNAIGCLTLTGLVVTQWSKERTLDGALASMTADLAAANAQATAQAERRAALERDVTVLKDALAATQQAHESTARTLAENAQTTTRLQADLATARDQVTTWQAAINARDARIHTLDAELTAARRRLDEAIAKLKATTAKPER